MVHHAPETVRNNDLSARDEFTVPHDVTFLNSSNIGPRLATVRAAETAALNRWSTPWMILLPMAIAALEHAQRWGVSRITAWMSMLTAMLAEIGDSLGAPPTPKSVRSPHFLGLHVGTERAKEISAALRVDGVYAAARGASIRVSPNMHTTAEDVSRFAGALAKVR